MVGTFALLDLPSQAIAVERRLRGWSHAEKLAWLGAHGKLERIPAPSPSQSYLVESTLGLRCVFFLADDRIVFFGDNTVYNVKAEEEQLDPALQQTRRVSGCRL